MYGASLHKMNCSKLILLVPVSSNGGVETHISHLIEDIDPSEIYVLTRFFNEKSNLAIYCDKRNVKLIKISHNKFSIIFQLLLLRFKMGIKKNVFYTTEVSVQSILFSWILFSRKNILNPVGNPYEIGNQINKFSKYFKNPKIIVESNSHLQKLKNKSNVEVLPHISNIVGYNPLVKRDKSKYVFGFLHWLHSNKNPIEVIEVFSRLYNRIPNVELKIRMNGPLKNEVKQKIKELKCENSITIINDWQNSNELFKIYSNIDASILWSKSEGLPLSLIESCSFNKPFISSNVGAVKELLEFSDQSKVINEPNSDQLFNAMFSFVQNQTTSKILSESDSTRFNYKFGKNYLKTKYNRIIRS